MEECVPYRPQEQRARVLCLNGRRPSVVPERDRPLSTCNLIQSKKQEGRRREKREGLSRSQQLGPSPWKQPPSFTSYSVCEKQVALSAAPRQWEWHRMLSGEGTGAILNVLQGCIQGPGVSVSRLSLPAGLLFIFLLMWKVRGGRRVWLGGACPVFEVHVSS